LSIVNQDARERNGLSVIGVWKTRRQVVVPEEKNEGTKMYNDKDRDEVVEVNQSETEKSRRSFLKKAGKFAVYTPPAVMLLMKPSFAHMSKSFVGRPKNCRTNGGTPDGLQSRSFKTSFKKVGKSHSHRHGG
jgi:hypothetical protein